ncbi:sigma-70 family RNA polymerase sigma factor [Microlunatus elymi]|uniref:Sigma-70 family RNA polymerase sigma factor n=1 Tax=Microlunatus elymi TaxID=2596828 RepID=A0A516Q3R2_9ACTN|nr:sigma-70 family RNA polymerase sigma factor [Microlunatus elymi]QDP97861.1 sigma-70 family RNA polymerase sigma factor [Microlunatus elymi]
MSASFLEVPSALPCAGYRSAAGEVEWEQDVRVFLAERDGLLRIVRRIVGDADTAEDLVQEAWIRWQHADRRVVQNPAAFLTTTATRLAINLIHSARHRHETTAEIFPDRAREGQLMQPGRDDPIGEPGQEADVELIIEYLLTRLNPAELAACLLRKSFDYPYAEIARVLSVSVANARQLVSRSRTRIQGPRIRLADVRTGRRLTAAFMSAAQSGDLTHLEGVLRDHLLGQQARAA